MIESIQHRLDLLGLVAADFQGIGMGSPGVVDRENGTVIGAYNLNWKTLQPIKEKIEKALGIPFSSIMMPTWQLLVSAGWVLVITNRMLSL